MKILFLTLGTEIVASSRTRVYQYLPYLNSRGFKTKVIAYTPQKITRLSNSSNQLSITGRFMLKMIRMLKMSCFLLLVPFYDIIFIQKVVLPLVLQTILKFMKVRIIFDFDDAIYTAHQVTNLTGRKERLLMNRLIGIIKLSKCICLENIYTGKFASQYNKNIFLITGPIDTERYFPAKKGMDNDKVVIGWIGSSSTTPYLSILFPVFRRLCRTHPNAYIKLIGATPINIPDVRVKQVDWDLETEVEDLQEFDIGIMPLPDDEWSRGKGGYKLLQYMATGMACIASPVGINGEIIEYGTNGFLASNEEEWFEKLSLLIENKDLIHNLGMAGRKTVEQRYSLEVACSRLAEMLEKWNGTK